MLNIKATIHPECPDQSIKERHFKCKLRKSPFYDLQDTAPVDIVKNGPLIFSYLPEFNHFYFSNAPDKEYFLNYYSNKWQENIYFETNKTTRNKLLDLSIHIKNRIKNKLLSRKDFTSNLEMILDRNSLLNNYLNAIDNVQVSLGLKNIQHIKNLNSSFIFTQYNLLSNFATLRPYLKNDSKVFDLGGGDGNLIASFIRQGIECFLLEPCKKSALLAEKKGANVINSVLESEKNRDNIIAIIKKSDILICNHSLEHYHDPNILFELCSKNMKQDAVICVAVPNAESNLIFMSHIYPLHLDCYTEKSLRLLANKHGFNLIEKNVSHEVKMIFSKKEVCNQFSIVPSFNMGNKFNRSSFLNDYSTLLEKQLMNYGYNFDSEMKKFEISLRGARPFMGLDYESTRLNSHLSSAGRKFKIELKNTNSSLINYETSNQSLAFTFMK